MSNQLGTLSIKMKVDDKDLQQQLDRSKAKIQKFNKDVSRSGGAGAKIHGPSVGGGGKGKGSFAGAAGIINPIAGSMGLGMPAQILTSLTAAGPALIAVAAGAAVAAAAVYGLYKAYSVYTGRLEATKDLNDAIGKNVVGTAAELSNLSLSFQNTALAMSMETGYSGAEIKNLMALALNSGVAADKITDVTKATLGYAKANGVSTKEAMKFITASEDLNKTLKEILPSYDEVTAKNDTFSATLNKTGILAGNIMNIIGATISDILGLIGQIGTGLADALNISTVNGFLDGLISATADAALFISSVSLQINKLLANFDYLVISLSSSFKNMTANIALNINLTIELIKGMYEIFKTSVIAGTNMILNPGKGSMDAAESSINLAKKLAHMQYEDMEKKLTAAYKNDIGMNKEESDAAYAANAAYVQALEDEYLRLVNDKINAKSDDGSSTKVIPQKVEPIPEVTVEAPEVLKELPEPLIEIPEVLKELPAVLKELPTQMMEGMENGSAASYSAIVGALQDNNTKDMIFTLNKQLAVAQQMNQGIQSIAYAFAN